MDDQDDDDVAVPVEVYLYDLTRGLASLMSQMIVGKQIDGVWHTGVVAYGREYFFGSAGIQTCIPGSTVLGEPLQKIAQGETFIPYQVFKDYIHGLGESTFAIGTYSLLTHNCNTFSNEVTLFLCGSAIPRHILDLPAEIINTPLGQQFLPLIDSLNAGSRGVTTGTETATAASLRDYQPRDRNSRVDSPEFDQLNSAIEESRRTSIALEERRNEINQKLAKKERKKKKRRQREIDDGNSSAELTPDSGSGSGTSCQNSPSPKPRMSDNEADVAMESTNGSEEARRMLNDQAEIEREERRAAEEKKKLRDPPIVFRDAVDVRVEFDSLVGFVDGILNGEEQQSLEELHQYMLEDEGSWALGDSFLNFVGRLLHDKSLKSDVRVKMLNVLAAAALKDDVILLLHQDRREHILMNYAHDVDRLSLEEQQALALFMVNMFENLSSSEWLLYISEWAYCNQTISNIRVTTKVAVNCLLADDVVLQDRGTAIIHNLACKEVFDDVAVEITMALLQYFNSSPPEENLFRAMKSLARFCAISPQDVPQLIQMIGPEPSKFRGASERVDEQIALISKKTR